MRICRKPLAPLLALLLLLSGCGEPPSAPEEEARAAYEALLAGDASLLGEEAPFVEPYFSAFAELEYLLMDLDGDGIDELLVQWAEFPGAYNGVFHYEDGALSVWQNDGVELSCRDYPLRDGTMVRQYDHGGSSFRLFRYLPGGETEDMALLYARTAPDNDGDLRPCPCYEVDGGEVEEAVFRAALEELVTDRLVPREDWTPRELPEEDGQPPGQAAERGSGLRPPPPARFLEYSAGGIRRVSRTPARGAGPPGSGAPAWPFCR